MIAVPELEDPNFGRTVILMVRHTPDEGAMGLILNRPLNFSASDIWAKVSDDPMPAEVPTGWGGPVQGPLVILHRWEPLADLTVLPGVYISTQREQVEAIIKENRQPFLFFLGYSGWGNDQLEQEAADGGWYHIPATLEKIFSDPYQMWKSCCFDVGEEVLSGDHRIPIDRKPNPNLN